MKLRPSALSAIAAIQVVSLAVAGSALGEVSSAATTAADPAASPARVIERMTLIHQDLALSPDANLTVTFRPQTPLAATDTVMVTVYPAVDTRIELALAIDDPSAAGRPSDSLDLNPAENVGVVTTGADGNVSVEIPTESATRSATAVQFPNQGVYPVVIGIIDESSARVGELITFVDRLPLASAEPRGTLAVAAIASITAPAAIPGSLEPLPADVVEQVDRLIAFPPSTRLTIDISPDVLRRLDPERLGQVNTVLARSLVVSTPRVPLDPSSAAAAGLKDLFIKLLRDGENETRLLSEVLTDQTVWISPEPITTAGAAMLREIGLRLIVISPETYAASPDSIGGYLEYSQLLLTRLTDSPPDPDEAPCVDDCMPTAVIDPGIESRLLDTGIEQERRALYLAADLVVWRDQAAAALSPVTGHTVIVGLSEGGVPDPQVVGRAIEMASTTGAIAEPTDLSDFQQKTFVQLVESTDFDISLPPATPPDIGGRGATLLPLAAASLAIESMLVEGKGRPERWLATIETLYSSSLTSAEVAATVAALTAEFNAIADAIVPRTPTSFTLSGRRTNVPMRFDNNSDEALRVMLSLDAGADKLQFPDNNTIYTLLPGESNEEVPVVARANGSVTVNMNLLTPKGDRVVETVVLQAKVNTLTGLAQVITGGALLILLTWWVRNLRRARRTRKNGSAMGKHPANGIVLATTHNDRDGDLGGDRDDVEPVITEAVIGTSLEPDEPASASVFDS